MTRPERKIKSKYQDMAVVVDTKVVAIEEYNRWYGNKYKNVFYCESKQLTPRMCIFWERTSLRVGDEVRLTGRVKDTGEFLCWNILILKRGKNGTDDIPDDS